MKLERFVEWLTNLLKCERMKWGDACFKDVDNAADQWSSVSEVQLNLLVRRSRFIRGASFKPIEINKVISQFFHIVLYRWRNLHYVSQ